MQYQANLRIQEKQYSPMHTRNLTRSWVIVIYLYNRRELVQFFLTKQLLSNIMSRRKYRHNNHNFSIGKMII